MGGESCLTSPLQVFSSCWLYMSLSRWVTLGKTSGKTAQLSSAQRAEMEQINGCWFEALSFELVCYTTTDNWIRNWKVWWIFSLIQLSKAVYIQTYSFIITYRKQTQKQGLQQFNKHEQSACFIASCLATWFFPKPCMLCGHLVGWNQLLTDPSNL